MSRPRSNSFQGTGNSVLSLPVGGKVVILGTENVVQRCPHLVGQVGSIYEIPVHPATWFKIQFDDGRIMTFRPSALQSYDDYKKGIKVPLKKPVKKDSCLTRESTPSAKPKTASPAEKSSRAGTTVLSDTDPDTWIGLTVFVMNPGKGQPEKGTVLRSGNGWVQLKTPTHGEVARRAYDLLIGEEEDAEEDGGKRKRKPTSKATRDDDDASVSSRKSKQSRNDRRRTAYVSDQDDDYDSMIRSSRPSPPSSSPLMNGLRSPSRLEIQIAERSRTSSTMDEDGTMVGRGRARSYSDSLLPSPKGCADGLPKSLSPLLVAPSRNGNKGFGDSERKLPYKDPRIPKELRDAKKQLVRQYVQKHNDRMRERPDLSYWLDQIKGGMVDREFERQIAQEFMDSVCKTCYEELWPGAQFCWNEACTSSPVYWKLPGAAGKAPTPTPRWSYSISKCIPDYGNVQCVADSSLLSPDSMAAATKLSSFFGKPSDEITREAEASLLTSFANSPRRPETTSKDIQKTSERSKEDDEDGPTLHTEIPRFVQTGSRSITSMEIEPSGSTIKDGCITHVLGVPRVEKVPDKSLVASYLWDAPVKVIGVNWNEQGNAMAAANVATSQTASPMLSSMGGANDATHVPAVSLAGSLTGTANASPINFGSKRTLNPGIKSESGMHAEDTTDLDTHSDVAYAMAAEAYYNRSRTGSESSISLTNAQVGIGFAEDTDTDNTDTSTNDSPLMKGVLTETGTAGSSPLVLSIKRPRFSRAVAGI